jgi:hypothetical protein
LDKTDFSNFFQSKMKLFLVLTIAIIYYFESSNACSCVRREPQQHYCLSDFAAVLKIGTRHAETEFQIYYDFTVSQVLRTTEKGTKSLANKRLLTTNNSAACGVILPEGKEVIITGYVDNDGNPHVSLCDYHALWSDVKDDIRAGFLGGYKCSTS